MYFLPLGYKFASGLLEDISEMHGGTAWGAGTFMVRALTKAVLCPYID